MTEDGSIESRIDEAMRARVQHFKDQADSLTFEGVRRLLEKDMLLDTHALDAHKGYVKQLVKKYLNDTEDDDNISKDSGQIKLEKGKKEGQIKLEKVIKEEEERPKEHQAMEDVKEIRSEDEGKMKDSPVMGLLTGNESAKSGDSKDQGSEKDTIPNEVMVKAAIQKRAAYFRSKSQEITMAGVRRLLEDDLELEKFSLDSFKKLISKQLDEVLNSPEIPKSVKKKTSVNSHSETPHKVGTKRSSGSSDSDSDDAEVDTKPKKKVALKGKAQKSEGSKKRKRLSKESQPARKKQTKLAEETSKENNTQDDDDSSAEKSESSAEKSVKKEVVPLYGKKVEHLKSIIKSCGMSVAPVIYKKAKQAPEDKREAFIIKELQEILSKEGLFANPSEKEIKEVRRRKERAKELEGIDMSNIVSGSRRRSTASFVAPPKPEPPIEGDGDNSEETDNENEEDEDEDEAVDEDEDEDVHASPGEEVHEDTEESD